MKTGNYQGFTLIELLVVIGILGILMAVSIFGLQGTRESARDAKRKADLEQIRSGLETYRADCLTYPNSLEVSLSGDGSSPGCPISNVYIIQTPQDPRNPNSRYIYSSNGTTYELCTSLEGGGDTVTCGGSSDCGTTCNYKVTNP